MTMRILPALLMSAALVLVACNQESPATTETTETTETTGSAASETLQEETVLADAGAAAEEHADDHGHDAPKVELAVATLHSVGDSGVEGVVYFKQEGDQVRVFGEITGLEPGMHGFHVHQWGDTTSLEDGLSAGGHFDPEGKPHGAPDAEHRHVGDLGNVEANDDGVAKIDMVDDVIELNGPHSIVGRGLVVHAKEDVFTQPTGDAGARVGLGVIGVADPEREPVVSP